MDRKTQKRLDALYRNTKSIPLLLLLSFALPIMFPITAGLGLLYFVWSKKLLQSVDSGQISLMEDEQDASQKSKTPSDKEKLAHLQKHYFVFLLPPIGIGVLLLLLVSLIFIIPAVS